MSLNSFIIREVKAISLAECPSVPKIMVIAGPNGIGKSTLLFTLSQHQGTTETGTTTFLYQPPHRVLRRTTVTRRNVFGIWKSFVSLLSQRSVQGYEGMSIQNPDRAPENVDEAGSTIKYTFGQLENRRQQALALLVDRAKAENSPIDLGGIPDIYAPLRDFTKYLLPHLTFSRIDFHDENNIKCYWKRQDRRGEMEIDVDELSSGEKSILILFYPLIENDIVRYLESLESGTAVEGGSLPPLTDRLMLIDEPELHLHPDLQSKILSYLRGLSRGSNIQFILTTHSPTILDQALDDELFVFSPPSEDTNENQLQRVASSIERLEALKQLAGDTYLITTGRAIVCIEGNKVSKEPTDLRLLEILYPRSTAFTMIPTGGKGNVINLVTRLRDHLRTETFGLRVYGITDRDQTSSSVDGVANLPVCMIENLLLDDDALLEYAQKLAIRELPDVASVKAALSQIVGELQTEEIEMRVMRAIKARTVRLRGSTLEGLKTSLASEILEVQRLLPADTELALILTQAKEEVDRIIRDGTASKDFRGKELLSRFYNRFVFSKGKSYLEFTYQLAEAVAKRDRVRTLLDPVFDQMLGE